MFLSSYSCPIVQLPAYLCLYCSEHNKILCGCITPTMVIAADALEKPQLLECTPHIAAHSQVYQVSQLPSDLTWAAVPENQLWLTKDYDCFLKYSLAFWAHSSCKNVN